MSINKDEILKEALKSNRVAETVDKLQLTKEQMYDALPILIDMANEIDDDSTLELTSLKINSRGAVMRTKVPSTKGLKYEYLDYLVTQDVSYINIKDEDEFIKEDGRKDAVNAFSQFLKDPKNNKGLYIYGEMGIGKTFMLRRFVKLIAQQHKEVGYVNLTELVSSIKKTFNNTDSSSDIVDLLKDVDYLFIDDIGAEKISSWFRDDFLFNILNERMDKKKPTFFSSNYSIEDLIKQEAITSGAKYPEWDKARRLVSRIKALSTEVFVRGTNKR